MDRKFSEVFGELGLRKDIAEFFSDVTVSKVSKVTARRLLRVYIIYDRMIMKDRIIALEAELARVLCGDSNWQVQVCEDYHLSSQYSTQYVVDNYYPSVLMEIDRHDKMIHTVLRNCKPEVIDGRLIVSLPDTFVAHKREEEICSIFSDVFQNRFHLPLEPEIRFVEAKESLYHIENEKRVQNEVAAIASRVMDAELQKSLEAEEEKSGENEDAANPFLTVSDGKNNAVKADASSDDQKKNESSGAATSGEKPADNGSADKGAADKANDKKSDNKADKSFGKKQDFSGSSKEGRAGRREGSGGRGRSLKMSDNPDVIYGRDFEGETMTMESIVGETPDAIIRGQVIAIESFDSKNGYKITKCTATDYTDTMRFKIILPVELGNELLQTLKEGIFVTVKGLAQYDNFDKEVEVGNITGIKKISDFRTKRADFNEFKRVELHAHSKMSEDGCLDISSLIKTAATFGHRAVAVTDTGTVQAFPDAAIEQSKIKYGEDVKADDKLKVIYGLEAYLVDDTVAVVVNERGQTLQDTFVVFDIETTGFVPTKNKIIEIGAVKVTAGEIVDRFSEFVNPEIPIPMEITELTSIKDSDVMDADTIEDILPRFLEFCKDSVLVAHNAKFDTSFIRYNAEKLGLEYNFTHTDTIEIARLVMPRQKTYQLHKLAEALKVQTLHHHRAVDDAEMTAGIFIKEIGLLAEKQVYTLDELNNLGGLTDDKLADMHASRAVILAKNEVGRRNLYRLVSMSHLRFLGKAVPKIPKSMLDSLREGLIVGSGSTDGELFQALINERPNVEISRIADYYDYLEIFPAGNAQYLINDDKMPSVNSLQDVRDFMKRIVDLGDEHGKIVCAAGDVHYLNEEDSIYRTIVAAGKKNMRIRDLSDTMYFHTTQEMLDEFSYLGSDKAMETVILNTNKIADMCDPIAPVRPDKCPPVIEDSDKTLRRICYDKAHSMYGEELPPIVSERLERELKSIIGNGYAVMYIIAQKLVWKSVEDGYLVGSRGSVGSSFVATMAGITEVNPLAPHYYCGKCRYSDFDSPELKEYAGRSGFDMPDKICPVCGEKLIKDGFDIPFETFLGFKGDKEPDIDLNFSSEYQSKAHKYTEVIFGYGQTYRAGTVGTLADKTAYGYVKHFFDDKGITKRSAELDRLSKGVMGVRNSTGQHPGGIVVLPVGEDINSFTPTQHPADDMTSPIITTHFDYHKIEQNLLKLDILGHDDPTMIRMLQDLTDRDPLTIPLDDPEVMELFKSTKPLGITPEDIGGTKLGTLGIPEFGTDFAMQMLIDTNPQAFSDLVRIAGLSHGTDVWLGNAETLIKNGTATISTAICTRDDIMTYLIGKGLEPEESFKIMENVRKGKVAKGKADKWPEWKADMIAHDVPDWYVWSCEKIQYMFPKAHAAAYVMMAWRVAYYKINYPAQYYAAFFSIRSKAFDYEQMCQGKQHLEYCMQEVTKRLDSKEASPKDKDSLRDMRLVEEMYARGIEFTKIDLYKSKATAFQVTEDGRIMPAFVAIDGLGDTNAIQIEDAARRGVFTSKEDFRQRTKTSQTTIDKMTELHILEGLPDSNQISIFDLLGKG